MCVLSKVSSSNWALHLLCITLFVNLFVYQCMSKHEAYNLQNLNRLPQLIIYYCTSMFQLEFATVAIIRLN